MSFDDGLILGMMLGGGGSGGDEWQPPADWLPVPEPGTYEINLLVEVIKPDEAFTMEIYNPIHKNNDHGTIYVDWGDGSTDAVTMTDQPNHIYTAKGKYLVHISTSADGCFLYALSSYGFSPKLLIAKLGDGIIVNNSEYADFEGAVVYNTSTFYFQTKLCYVKLSGKGGLPKSSGFYQNVSLQRVDISIPPDIIPDNTFSRCRSLRKFDFSCVKQIGNSSLQDAGFYKIDAPLCESIGVSGVHSNYNLAEVNLPSCTSVGTQGFYYNIALESAVFADGCTFGSGCFYGDYCLYPRPDGSTN